MRGAKEREALDADFRAEVEQREKALSKAAPNLKALQQFEAVKVGPAAPYGRRLARGRSKPGEKPAADTLVTAYHARMAGQANVLKSQQQGEVLPRACGAGNGEAGPHLPDCAGYCPVCAVTCQQERSWASPQKQTCLPPTCSLPAVSSGGALHRPRSARWRRS